ncbi:MULTISPECIES: (d)CMP kinase [Pontibacillus]|uniref:Cytidylate kinase n=1 Tax=Pontibacillus chungwhensis TaxID=265426 RepID=A0ABY8URV7_9BACI|nr:MULTISPECIES: (d)CMP kinase [Pontibacillus]MCD5323011.1 (d)CMP kinase [Pontibacillus sp. HN14]WIF96405.1 (d)CMP kinase [Pontibacillus chungwhensis]
MKQNIAIAIDGPAAAGKSTVAKIIAEKLTYVYIDTGAMYRALTFKAIQEGIPLEEEEALMDLLEKTVIDLQQSTAGQQVLLDGEEVTLDIRTEQVTNQVSIVAKHGKVRHEMVKRQRELAAKRGVVMDGRDIGSHVIPDAEVKIFLIASVQERAERRHKENKEKGFSSDLEKLKEEIRRRDQIDSEREVSPLVKADDAVEIDTTSLSIKEVAEKILRVVHDKLDRGE